MQYGVQLTVHIYKPDPPYSALVYLTSRAWNTLTTVGDVMIELGSLPLLRCTQRIRFFAIEFLHGAICMFLCASRVFLMPFVTTATSSSPPLHLKWH